MKIFENHDIDITNKDEMQIVDFHNNHSCANRITFIFHENKCYISGDYGSWVFECTWKPSIYNLPADNKPYFLEKLSNKCKKSVFDSCACEQDIDEWAIEFKEDYSSEYSKDFFEELAEQVEELKSRTENEWLYIAHLYEFINFMQEHDYDMCETPLYYAGRRVDVQLDVVLQAILIIQSRLAKES